MGVATAVAVGCRLLAQDLQDFGLTKFQWLNGVGKATNLKLRISETNSL